MKKYLGLAAIVFALVLMTAPAMAALTDPFSGSVADTTDIFGDTVKTINVSGTWVWGIPGYGFGTVAPVFTGLITDFHFSTLPEPGTTEQFKIAATSQSLGGLTTETRFQNDSDSVLWTRSISADGYSVTFTAPSIAASISPGESFFVNIQLSDPSGLLGLDDFFWTANYTGVGSPVPVPPSMILLGTGLFGFVGFARRKLFGK